MDPTIATDLKENMNTPRLAPSAIEVERLRMQMTMKNALGNNSQQQQQQQQQLDTVGEIPTINQRGVRRLKSSNPNIMAARNASGPLAPTKSTDAAASIRGSAVARANSSRNLLQRATSSTSRSGLIPARSSSSQGLRPYNKDQIVNSSISRKPAVTDGILNMHIRGPGGTLGLQRNESEMSLGEFSISDGSLFTTDSVFVRKSQFIADALDNDNTYDENDSFADHESFMTRDSEVPLLYEMPRHSTTTTAASSQRTPSAATSNTTSSTASSRPVMTLNDLESLKMHKLNISTIHQHHNPNNNDDISLVSYGTMTTDDLDYTDGYANDETEYVE
jgi:hypothetical protein